MSILIETSPRQATLGAATDTLIIVAAEGPGHLYGGVGRHVCEIMPRLGPRRPTRLVCVPSYCLAEAPKASCVTNDDHGVTVYDPGHVMVLRQAPFDRACYEYAAERMLAAVLPYLPTRAGALVLEDHYDAGLALRLAEALQVRRLVVFSHLPLSARFSYFDKGADEERQQVLEAGALLAADTVLVPSNAARRSVAQVYPLPPDRIDVLPLGTTRIESVEATLAIRPARVTTVARLTEQKGWRAWLDIVAQVEARGSHATWTIVGDGPLRATVLERLSALVPPARIEWTPYLGPTRELPALLTESSVFLLPSAHETFGLAALEAAAAGTVPVLMNISTVAEIWGEAAICFPPGATCEAAAQIDQLLREPAYRISAAQAALAHAREFDWDLHVDRLEQACFDG